MFPDIIDVVLQDVAENSMNSNEAVNVILEKQNQMQGEAAPYCKKVSFSESSTCNSSCDSQKLFKDYANSGVDLTIPTNTIHVNRGEDMFTQVRLIYKRMDKNKLKAVPNVVFEGNDIHELGSDAGGPSREFFFLALTSCTQEMQSSGSMLFTGTGNHLVPVHDWDLLEDGNFILVGKMIGHSLIHGGTGFVGMS